MPTENYSHMVMEMENMVGGEGLGNDAGEGGVEIPLPGGESMTGLISEMKTVMAVELWFAEHFVVLGRSVLGVYMELEEKMESRRRLRAKRAPMARPRYLTAPWGLPCAS